LGVGLTAWYLAPQLYLLPRLAGGLAFPLYAASWLTPLGVLLAPAVVPPVHLPTPLIHSPMHFGLPAGWPLLAALALTLPRLPPRVVRRPRPARPPAHLPTPLIHSPMHFGLQAGWPVLAALAVTLHGLAARRPGLMLCRGTAGRLAVFFLLALVLVWTPFDF